MRVYIRGAVVVGYDGQSVTTSASVYSVVFFFFNDTATTEIYTLSLHDALPICSIHLSVLQP